MTRIPFACIALLIALTCGLALASPTASDYAICHRKAALNLQMCLDRGGASECWAEARSVNERCYTSVREEYRVDKKKVEAKRRAEAEAEAKSNQIRDRDRDRDRDSTR